MSKKIIIGFGTGRCGTQSLARFLNQQEGWNVTHEKVGFGWYPAMCDFDTCYNEFMSREEDVIGDVAFYWVQYIGLILTRNKNVKVINLYRDDEEVIESFWSYKSFIRDYKSFWENEWFGYPYDNDKPTKDAIANTIKRYRMLEDQVHKYFPFSIIRMKTEDLSNEESLNKLLNWLGCKEKNLNSFHTNKREQILASKNAQQHERLFQF